MKQRERARYFSTEQMKQRGWTRELRRSIYGGVDKWDNNKPYYLRNRVVAVEEQHQDLLEREKKQTAKRAAAKERSQKAIDREIERELERMSEEAYQAKDEYCTLQHREDYFSATQLKERNWTETTIKRHLGNPDATLPNPYYSRAGRMRLWLKARVVETEDVLGISFRTKRLARENAKEGNIPTSAATLDQGPLSGECVNQGN